MNHLIFSLEVTIPIFLLMVLGALFKHWHLFSDSFVKRLNKFVFVVALPVLMFKDLSRQDFRQVWDMKYIGFCFLATSLSILISYGFSMMIRTRSVRGEFTQVAYRSSATLLGMAFIQNIYGHVGMGPLMVIGTVPLYNICAVIILTLTSERELQQSTLKECIKGIVTNPILIGIVVGILYSFLRLPHPVIFSKTVDSIAALASPLGLMALGGSVTFSSVKKVWRPAVVATFLKLVGFVMLFMPIAIHLGFRESELVAILVMLGSASTVSCFVMAKNMGHSGQLTAAVIVLTTVLSSFTLTFWLFLLRVFSLI